MAAYHYTPPSADSLKGWAHVPSDFPQEMDHELWDDNWDAFEIYTQNQTQWRAAAGGFYALDMMVFRHELDRRQYDRVKYDEMLWALGIIEAAALSEHKT